MNDTDESYDPHARMHESFPRVDSGSEMAGDIIPLRGEDSMGKGGTLKANPYYYGTKQEPGVHSILPALTQKVLKSG